MDDLVCVIVGDWVCRESGVWEFLMAAGKFAKIISVAEVKSFPDLLKVIRRVFKLHEHVKFRLCFWYPDVINICTRTRMPPVDIDSDESLGIFMKEFELFKALNMFMSFDVEESDSSSSGSPQLLEYSNEVLSFEEVYVDEDLIAFADRAEEAYRKNGPDKMNDFLAMEEAEKQRLCGVEYGKGKCLENNIETDTQPHILQLVDHVDEYSECVDLAVVTADVCTARTVADPLLHQLVELVDEDAEDVDHVVVTPDVCTGRTEICDTTGHPILTPTDSQPTQATLSHSTSELAMCTTRRSDPSSSTSRNIRSHCYVLQMPVCDENDPFFVDPPPQLNDIYDEYSDTFYVGRKFDDKDDLKKCLARYAMENQFCYKVGHSDKSRIIVRCIDRKCPWRVYAKYVEDESEVLEIKTLVLRHQCCLDSRGRYGEMAKLKVLAKFLQTKFANGKKGPRACDIPDIVLAEMNVQITYRQAWYAKEVALANARGSEEESYKLLSKYLAQLVQSNPGSITDVFSVVNKEGKHLFKYLFVSFGASIAGFPYVRKVVAIDGTHLTGKYKGTLVAASCQDGNMQIFLLAFGIVDSENELSWVWFLDNLKKIVNDDVDLVFVSDRHHAINAALKRVYPLAFHGACIIHIGRNVNARFKSEGLADLVSCAARAYTVQSFQRLWTEIEQRSTGCAEYLVEIGFQHWTRIHSPRNRFNLMSSNICESFNAAIKKAADFPIIAIVEFVRTMSMRWWCTRRGEASKCVSACTTQIEGLLLRNHSVSTQCAVISASDWIYQVNDRKGNVFTVDLQNKYCSCNVFNVMKVPCAHAIAACKPKGINVYSLVDPCYTKDNWYKVYEQVIMPVPRSPCEDEDENELEEGLLPPQTRRPSGRPPKRRYKSVGEFDMRGRRPSRCGRCSQTGHNRVTCKNII